MVGLFIYFVYRLFQSVTMPASLISLPFLIVVCLPLQCTSFNLALVSIQHTVPQLLPRPNLRMGRYPGLAWIG